MNIAIVGTTARLTCQEQTDIEVQIAAILSNYSIIDDVIISGGAKGVDTLVVNIAIKLGFKIEEFLPGGYKWSDYRVRNIQIAEACTKLYCITVAVKDEKCYHHGANLQEHQKTAGCWTLSVAEKYGKYTKLIVVLKAGLLETE